LKDNITRSKRTALIKWTVYLTFFLLVAIPVWTVVIAVNFGYESYTRHLNVYDKIVIVRGIAKLAIDIYMFPRFYRTFYFFVNAKRQYIKRILGEDHDLTLQNQLTIWSVMILWALNIFYSLSVAIVWGIWYSSYIQTLTHPDADFWFRVIISPITWIFNFLTLMGLLYLFHYSGRRTLETPHKPESFSGIAATKSNALEPPTLVSQPPA